MWQARCAVDDPVAKVTFGPVGEEARHLIIEERVYAINEVRVRS